MYLFLDLFVFKGGIGGDEDDDDDLFDDVVSVMNFGFGVCLVKKKVVILVLKIELLFKVC